MNVTMPSSGSFAAFDNLRAVTMRATDGDERHRPFLPKGGRVLKVEMTA